MSAEAKSTFPARPMADRAEKGSAMSMIAAETKARVEKTAKLRLMRMEQEAAAPPPEAPAKPVRKRKRAS
ncbi:hypothetical protein [Aureimonas populi]|uniref:Transcriptional regulator n=1 Tax=Aureimonas populi TaxID=1701758 RepID=A0ABW5CMA3_9HYPH|nr:hypothetical protein [Aureimonas populi]